MEKMEQIQTDKKEVQRERKKPEQTEQTKQAAVCIGQNEQKEVKYGRYRVTSTFAGTENLTDLLECYIDGGFSEVWGMRFWQLGKRQIER